MSTMEQLEENVKVADNISPLSSDELSRIETMMKENERLAGLYCTGCKYCMPCPAGINIPAIFNIMNYHRIYEITEFAKSNYAQIGKNPWMKYEKPPACTDCGECEAKCPQAIPVREQLKETHRTLEG
jgi:predicted aldo/keto reductase-like oxidoreductase